MLSKQSLSNKQHKKIIKIMGKSKHRKNHKEKVDKRHKRIEQEKSMLVNKNKKMLGAIRSEQLSTIAKSAKTNIITDETGKVLDQRQAVVQALASDFANNNGHTVTSSMID
jgi:LAS superfamily LD-carboxypeptidase LdcB